MDKEQTYILYYSKRNTRCKETITGRANLVFRATELKTLGYKVSIKEYNAAAIVTNTEELNKNSK